MMVDLTRTFQAGIPTYPGDPVPTLEPIAIIEKQGYTDHLIKSGLHVGTHIDAPLHMIAGAKRITDYPAEKFFNPGIVIDARGQKIIDENLLKNIALPSNTTVCILTGQSAHFAKPSYFEDYPEVTEAFARCLVNAGITMLGIDSPSPDREPFPIHKLLLEHDILIIENLTNMEALLPLPRFDIMAFPVRIAADAAPARVIAVY